MFFKAKSNPRTFAIGDIHGCARELELLIEQLKIRENDTVVFLGDYVDRGPDSQRVIDFVLDLSKRCKVVALKGNHEELFLDFLEHPESAGAGSFVLNGGGATLESYEGADGSFEIPAEHIEFLKGLKLFYEDESYFFVHAGVPEVPLSSVRVEPDEQFLIWTRQPFLSSTYQWEKIIVHGHTPVNQAQLRPNRINLDTGCVYGGDLTALELPKRKFHRVRRDKSKAPIRVPINPDNRRTSMRFPGRLPVTVWCLDGVDANKEGTFETLNYNSFGLLMREMSSHSGLALEPGDRIRGRIGPEGAKQTRFEGTIVRSESRRDQFIHGVKIERISDGDDGQIWVERPKS